MRLARNVTIPLAEITVRASRSSGPGGQHANVTASRIEASFDVDASLVLTDELKRRLVSKLGHRVTAVAQDERSQTRNRELALERLQARLSSALRVKAPRTPTRPTRASQLRRVEAKRSQAQRKRQRQSPEIERE